MRAAPHPGRAAIGQGWRSTPLIENVEARVPHSSPQSRNSSIGHGAAARRADVDSPAGVVAASRIVVGRVESVAKLPACILRDVAHDLPRQWARVWRAGVSNTCVGNTRIGSACIGSAGIRRSRITWSRSGRAKYE